MGARTLEVADGFEANELFGRNGWTDGLPIVPPTPELVRVALDAALLEPDRILGVEPVRGLAITAEKVAVNAVMAGCRSAHLPVVAAAVEAMCEPAYLLHGSAASTGGSAPVVIVNGPIRAALGLNAIDNALGGGGPNAVIGRALRLVLINLLGCVPGVLDHSTLGQSTAANDEEPAAASAFRKPSARGPSARRLRTSRSITRSRLAHAQGDSSQTRRTAAARLFPGRRWVLLDADRLARWRDGRGGHDRP